MPAAFGIALVRITKEAVVINHSPHVSVLAQAMTSGAYGQGLLSDISAPIERRREKHGRTELMKKGHIRKQLLSNSLFFIVSTK